MSCNVKFPFFCNSGVAGQGHEDVIERCLLHREMQDGAVVRVDLVEECAYARSAAVSGNPEHEAIPLNTDRTRAERVRYGCERRRVGTRQIQALVGELGFELG